MAWLHNAKVETKEEKEAKAAEALYNAAKNNRAKQVSEITVTTSSGKTFDGDEESQTRMSRAIVTSDILGRTETNWKLADNTVAAVTIDEMKEALGLAMQAQESLWFI